MINTSRTRRAEAPSLKQLGVIRIMSGAARLPAVLAWHGPYLGESDHAGDRVSAHNARPFASAAWHVQPIESCEGLVSLSFTRTHSHLSSSKEGIRRFSSPSTGPSVDGWPRSL